MRVCCRLWALILIVASTIPGRLTAATADQTATGAAADFCFLHVSDIHLSPAPFGTDVSSARRGSDVITWLCSEAAKPQVLGPSNNPETPPPAFVAATGDVTEYGVIHETWDVFESLFKPLGVPLYVVPGNHDNTWTAMLRVMRQRHGSDHYSFDRFGCHFTFIDTATPQEPVPSIDQRTLTWLARDLEKVPRTTPVFVFCHHPLSSNEFAKPYEQLRLIELLEQWNVVLLMMGHGHGARHERWGMIDSVMGGSTYGPNAGYGITSVCKGVLRSAYRFHDASKPIQVLIEKPVAPAARATLKFHTLGQVLKDDETAPVVRTSGMAVRVRVAGNRPAKVTASIDGDDKAAVKLTENAGGVFGGNLPVGFLCPGLHFARVVADFDGYQIDRARTFLYLDKTDGWRSEVAQLSAGVKAAPLWVDDKVIACTTAGQVVRVSFAQPRPAIDVLLDAGVEILHPPAIAASTLYVSAAEQGVYAITLDGRRLWQWKPGTGAAVYGRPVLDHDRLFVGDLEGLVHAIDRKSGKSIWSKRHAGFSIEQPLLLHEGRLYFGAWDGQLYCIDAREGNLVWKKPGPAGHLPEPIYKSRYYAPADCPPLIVGDRLFVCDRAYRLGSYSLAGEYLGEIAKDISAIGLTADGKGFYARGLAEGLSRYDASGKIAWTSGEVVMGRFPVPPVEAGGRVYACSNRGRLYVLDAATGKVLWQYQVAPQLHVMAGVGADVKGLACVAGMDGTLTRVSREDK